MTNTATHFQTSFRVMGSDPNNFMRIKATVFGWVLGKEKDKILREKKRDFFYRCDWSNLYLTHSSIVTSTLLSAAGEAWAIRYTEVDKGCGRQRFWYTDIGLKKDADEVIVSVHISYARNTEDLSGKCDAPEPTVPTIVRYILRKNKVYCGRPEFRLIEMPLLFETVGTGKIVADFITSSERRYPLIVFNGNSQEHVKEANRLARDLAGKCQIVVVATSQDLMDEMRHYLPQDYWVAFGYFRVYFPFNLRRNSPERHRWYDISNPDYATQRNGIVHGLLRNHILQEKYAVESVRDVSRLIISEKLIKLNSENPAQQKELEDFFKLHDEVEKERDAFKAEAASFALEVDSLETQARQLEWRCKELQGRLDVGNIGPALNMAKVFATLPDNLHEVAQKGAQVFSRLIITEKAINAAKDYDECKCVREAWEILAQLQECMWILKFDAKEQVDWERVFREKTGYSLAMSEGKQTQDDKNLMKLRKVVHKNFEYDITPHVKHGNVEPKLVRVHFAFDEAEKKIIIGHIGKHIPNYTSKNL